SWQSLELDVRESRRLARFGVRTRFLPEPHCSFPQHKRFIDSLNRHLAKRYGYVRPGVVLPPGRSLLPAPS
ncbi:MAG: hypothetical protein MI919_05980, partial [Holophagales bacterium]|nr:hypothetical protein [Holophagales bacterium]